MDRYPAAVGFRIIPHPLGGKHHSLFRSIDSRTKRKRGNGMKKLVTFRSPFTRLNASATRWAWVTALIVLNAVFCAGQSPPNTDGWVVLPVDDYRALRLAAFPAERQPEPTPVEATLTRVDYGRGEAVRRQRTAGLALFRRAQWML